MKHIIFVPLLLTALFPAFAQAQNISCSTSFGVTTCRSSDGTISRSSTSFGTTTTELTAPKGRSVKCRSTTSFGVSQTSCN
jgi:hypothetical protein